MRDSVEPGLHEYLRRAWIFLPNTSGENSREILFSKVLLSNQIFVTIYFVVWIFLSNDNSIVLNSDFNSIMGKHRKAFDLIWILWGISCGWGGLHIHRNPLEKNHPWWKLSEMLSKGKFYGSEGFTLSVQIFKFVSFQQAFCAPLMMFVQAAFFIAHKKVLKAFLPLITFIAFQIAIAIRMGVSHSVNMGPLFCLHQYAYGVVFGDQLKRILLPKQKPQTLPDMEGHIRSSLCLYDDLMKTQDFYTNSCTFVVTFIAQLFILYHILFTELAILTKIEFFLYGIMNWFWGQSLTFFSSWFVTYKVEYN